jgi:hypothetical protein
MHRPALPALLLAAALSACTQQRTAQECATPSDCPADARCRESVCVANAPPVALLSVPASPVAFALVSLSGTSSFDPDPEDGIASYRWTIRSAGADCPPPVVAGTEATASVRFGCPGAHEVELVVTDGLGRSSEPSVATVTVAPDPGPALVTAGADVAVQHGCLGMPLLCRADVANGSIALSSTGPGDAGITYAWTVQPPAGRALGVGRRVTFTPGPDVPDPSVVIETDGLGISGDWLFRVEARDAAGAVGAAVMRVSIGNHPPELVHTPGPVPHVYDAVGQAFHATGEIAVAVSDPDGDPIVRQVTAHHVGDGSASTFTALDVGDKVTFSITVPYDGPTAPQRLIGGAELERSIRFSAVDVNGATAEGTWGVVVENERPVATPPPLPVAVNHSYSPSSSSYVATATLDAWSDPEGDPLTPVPSVAAGCTAPTLVAGTASITCFYPFTGSPAAEQFAGPHAISYAVRDPWASTSRAIGVTVLNRPPIFLVSAFTVAAACVSETTCCEFDPDTHVCMSRDRSWGPASIPSGVFLADPDGDPLSVVFFTGAVGVSPSNSVCTPSTCAFTFQVPASTSCGDQGSVSAGLTVTDGAAPTPGSLTFMRVCG